MCMINTKIKKEEIFNALILTHMTFGRRQTVSKTKTLTQTLISHLYLLNSLVYKHTESGSLQSGKSGSRKQPMLKHLSLICINDLMNSVHNSKF